MAPPGGGKRKTNGLRMTELVKTTARDVVYQVFLWGTPDKLLDVSLDDYLDKLTKDSSANYKRVHQKQRKFDGTQQTIIAGDTTGKSYDITLLHKVIKLACKDVAPFNDDKWKAGLNHLESLITKIKEVRNEVCHEELEMSDNEFRDKVRELRNVLSETLTAAKEKFGQSETKLREETIKMNDSLFEVYHQVLGEEDLLKYCHASIMIHFIRSCKQYLSTILQNYTVIDPLHFHPDSGVLVKVEKIFAKILVTQEDSQGKGTELEYTKLLTLAQDDPVVLRPQLLMTKGEAGCGKTTLMSLVMQEWLDGGRGSLTDLHQYQLVLRIQCRDTHIKSFNELLQQMMPDVCTKYKNLTLPLIKMCRLLVLVDGLDEINDESSKAVTNLLNVLKDIPKCTLLITSRPEAITSFKRNIPTQFKVHNIELIGIADEERPELVRRYIQEFQRQTNTNQNIDHLMQTVRKICGQEHFRLPLNLVFLAWQCFYDPGSVTVDKSQTDLYHWAHTLSKEKLQQRLTLDCNPNKDKVEQLMEECLESLYLTMLQALARHQLVLTPQELQQVINACKARKVPHKEVLSAFLKMRAIWTPMGVQHEYSCPHKGLQDYLGAQHVVTQLMLQQKQQPTTSSIKVVLEKALGDNVELKDLINALKHMSGLLHLHMNPVPDQLVEEVVDLLHQSGVRDKNAWLDVLEDTKLSPAVLVAIARRFPVDGEIEVTDGRVGAYSVLLPHLPPTKVVVRSSGDPTPLLSALARHTCTKVVVRGDLENYWLAFLANIPQRSPPTQVEVSIRKDPSNLTTLVEQVGRHTFTCVKLEEPWYHPHPTTTPEPFLQAVLSRDGLEEFMGQVTVGMTSLPTTIRRLYLAVANDNQARTLLPLLHSMPNLEILHVHVGSQVSPAAITRTLPVVSGLSVLSRLSRLSRLSVLSVLSRLSGLPGLPGLSLHLSDVTEGGVHRIVQLVASLQPPGRYGGLYFPRCQLSAEGWMGVVEGLARQRVNMRGWLVVPDDPTTKDLDTLTKTRLGVDLMRENFKEWQ